MGLNYYYLGLPADAEALQAFRGDARMAENVLQILLMDIPRSINFHPLLTTIETAYPEIDSWRYQPKWRGRTACALRHAVDEAFGSGPPGRSIGERIVLGDELFLSNESDLHLANLFRITSPPVVKKYAEFWRSFDMKSLNVDDEHAARELADYFQRVASIGNLSILCMTS